MDTVVGSSLALASRQELRAWSATSPWLDESMATIVPKTPTVLAQGELSEALGETLEAVLDFMGATAGWIGTLQNQGRLTFLIRRGAFGENWLTLQQGQASVWGFGVREDITLLNDLPPLPALGEPPLRNLLSCPLRRGTTVIGQVVVANKPSGFSSHDAAVLQCLAHLISFRLVRHEQCKGAGGTLSATVLRRVLDHFREGILILDESNRLLFANPTWTAWTGFSLEDLLGRTAPFPFWVSHRDLAVLAHANLPPSPPHPGQEGPQVAFPFRRRDDSIFWCMVETFVEQVEGQRLLIALLNRATAGPALAAGEALRPTELADLALPFAAVMTDSQGRLVWANHHFTQQLAPGADVNGKPLADFFTGSTTALQRFFQSPAADVCLGQLLLNRTDSTGFAHPFVTFWVMLGAEARRGYLFGFSEDWNALGETGSSESETSTPAERPGPDCLVLEIGPDQELDGWDDRWQKLTGLTAADLERVPREAVLDWLFPRQRDRDLVADWVHQSTPRGHQARLELLTQSGSQPFLCTWLPLAGRAGRRWLLLVDESRERVATGFAFPVPLRRFLRGLIQLLNAYFLTPIGLAEQALDRDDLPPEVASWFEQILESCQRSGRLLAALHDLTADTPGEMSTLSLTGLVREFLEELGDPAAAGNYELVLDLPAVDLPVRANPQMLKTVLRHLLSNAEQALGPRQPRRITLRVFVKDKEVTCAVTDTGEGLPTEDGKQLLIPFASTKGPFASVPGAGVAEATGLGLTVCQHLLALHGGQLELRNLPEGGVVAQFTLSLADVVAFPSPARPAPGAVRSDVPAEARGPRSVR
jgi:PAS domain S-box-containing protein